MDDYVGFIRMVAFDFVPFPDNYAPCDGRAVNVGEYQALTAVMYNQFGGDGRTQINLPNLQGRSPIGATNAGGTMPQAKKGGVENVSIQYSEMPRHTHVFNGLSGGLEKPTPGGNYLPEYAKTTAKFYATAGTPTPMNPNVLAPAGGATAGVAVAHENMPPFLGINFVICKVGSYPVHA
ncbi:phage tail protein [Emticicia sp. 17c]|uniref:phage tail protein n=1 Tax=Emticicia sp. 17c TaxID=3127704 RepID=UPI00301C4D74